MEDCKRERGASRRRTAGGCPPLAPANAQGAGEDALAGRARVTHVRPERSCQARRTHAAHTHTHTIHTPRALSLSLSVCVTKHPGAGASRRRVISLKGHRSGCREVIVNRQRSPGGGGARHARASGPSRGRRAAGRHGRRQEGGDVAEVVDGGHLAAAAVGRRQHVHLRTRRTATPRQPLPAVYHPLRGNVATPRPAAGAPAPAVTGRAGRCCWLPLSFVASARDSCSGRGRRCGWWWCRCAHLDAGASLDQVGGRAVLPLVLKDAWVLEHHVGDGVVCGRTRQARERETGVKSLASALHSTVGDGVVCAHGGKGAPAGTS